MNALVNGMHGRLGKKLVLRTLRGKIIASQAPGPQQSSKQTERQRETRDRFRLATRYAKKMMLDPGKKEYYGKKAARLGLPNAYTAAITEYMRRPAIVETKASRQSDGSVVLYVVATKRDFDVKEVKVKSIVSADIVFELNGTQNKRGQFVFKLDSDRATAITITASDEPDNAVSQEIYIPDLMATQKNRAPGHF